MFSFAQRYFPVWIPFRALFCLEIAAYNFSFWKPITTFGILNVSGNPEVKNSFRFDLVFPMVLVDPVPPTRQLLTSRNICAPRACWERLSFPCQACHDWALACSSVSFSTNPSLHFSLTVILKFNFLKKSRCLVPLDFQSLFLSLDEIASIILAHWKIPLSCRSQLNYHFLQEALPDSSRHT